MKRLALVATHPIQYYAPWFRHLATKADLDLKVWYLWDFGVTSRVDKGFRQAIRWDVPLLDGYDWTFVPNRSRRPGTDRFWGLDNPELIPRLRTFEPGAVLCLGYNYATFARLLARWDGHRRPLLLRGDSHRLTQRRGVRAWLKGLALSVVFRHFGAFLYVGSANRDYLRQHGVPEERMFFSPHAVDNDRFIAAGETARREATIWRRALGIAADWQVILFAGKFENKKRPNDLLQAFARAALPNAALLFVGAGELEGQLRQAAAGMPRVHFAPFQNQSQMPRVYAAADVVVLPSFGPSETWGLCVNEAMCLAKPVIVSSHAGCACDLVKPGHNGWVFRAGAVDDLVRCLREACLDPEGLRRRGQAGLERVRAYSYELATRGLQEALEYLDFRPRRRTSVPDQVCTRR